MSKTADHSGVAIHPPLFFLALLLLGVVLDDRLHALPIFTQDHWRWSGVLGIALGVAISVSGQKAMARHHTNINPTQPTTAVVETGPFRFTRNPLYLSLTAIYIGLSLLLNTWWSLFVLAPLWLVMHFGVVLREERYLERKFGDTYRQYRARVRRYL
jgi:protein-S-isoprenylcysteine O-methyltransferase Ste14